MANVTVQDFATELKVPVEVLLEQLKQAGVRVDNAASDVSEEDKRALLNHLAGNRGAVAPGGEPRRITLKRKETTELRVGGNRGAPSKTVSIEVRKRRTYVKRGAESGSAEAEAAGKEQAAGGSRGAPSKTVSIEVRKRRPYVKRGAESGSAEAEAAAKEQAAREAAARAAAEASARRQQEEAERKLREEEEARRKALEEARQAAAAAVDPAARTEAELARQRAEENLRRATETRRQPPPPPSGPRRDRPRRDTGPAARAMRGRERKRRQQQEIKIDTQHAFEKPVSPIVREVEVPEVIMVGELANRMAVKATDLIRTLMGMGVMVTINQSIDQDTATLAVEELGHKVKTIKASDVEQGLLQAARGGKEEATSEATSRPPVVTIMGHVDHGKTTLLDHIRKTRVAASEQGGITQHIGAYNVKTEKGTITFLDTPGHAAFTRMRARGAEVTDIVVLVVAGDDGVMPQTREAIQHAKAAGVPIVVAVTKMDKPESDLERAKTELSKEEVLPEDWGGDVQFIGVSAHSGDGVSELLDAILLQAEVLELKAPADTPAEGTVVESSLDKGRGPVATVLVTSGTLRQGDMVLAGPHFGRVRAMFDESRKPVKSAGPSMPVEIVGLGGVPEAGDGMLVAEDERKARELAELRGSMARESKLAKQQAMRMEQVFARMGEGGGGEEKVLRLIVKADVQGSAEAISESLTKLPSAEVRVQLVSVTVGGISETDVELALASQAILIAFNARPESTARRRIQEAGIDVRYYSVIYELIDDVTKAISGMLGTETREQIVGLAEVREVFRSSKFGNIAGCLVVDGEVRRTLPVRVLRDSVVIFEGQLDSLRRFKDDVQKVEAGTECGIGVKNYNDIKAGDQIECFDRIEVQRTIEAETAAAAH